MRILASFAVVLVLATGVPELVAAQTAGTVAEKPDKPKRAVRNISGKVQSAAADTIVVRGREKGKDAEWTFAIDPMTHIRRGSKSIVAADLKPGDAVQVRYLERDGKAQAESILVTNARK